MSDHGLRCTEIAVSPGGGPPILRGLSLDVPAGTRTVLVGPSGAGKTTLLRAIAGLEPLDGGRVQLGGRRIDGLAPHRRKIAVVFQEPRLLAHLDVLDNIALPLRAAGMRKQERRRVAAAHLEEVGLAALARRRVQGLSGGEQQRIALARALTAAPQLLLLDEPLGALDPNRRGALRRLICTIQRDRGLTTVVVTHDRNEAAELGDHIALMLEGRIVQHDEPRGLFERPVSAAVARFFGTTNLLPDGDATLAIRPEHVVLADEGELRGRVIETTYAGDHVRVIVDCDGRSITAHVAPHETPRVGDEVGIVLPGERLWRVPPRVVDHEQR
ncbi:ABC transporter ATP-binding protein [Paraconexibacter antarcticus]|uniref:ABC transporter ATP-binding protein n=1 Tax=Paraconexibacter antarcticus TaxID=2949664 RepID=A0ABY5DQN1_9ACTN|nr:ABC transporter ATP-binding protein [Paraconexibacter antarcticus]UTI64338.1 ABC transporter ATP-binding protein [Paraconexibacter antarcticus]